MYVYNIQLYCLFWLLLIQQLLSLAVIRQAAIVLLIGWTNFSFKVSFYWFISEVSWGLIQRFTIKSNWIIDLNILHLNVTILWPQ